MTIRMLQAWNGYPQQTVVSMSASEETRLVGLGIASFDLDGPAENVRMAQLATDAGAPLKVLLTLAATSRFKHRRILSDTLRSWGAPHRSVAQR